MLLSPADLYRIFCEAGFTPGPEGTAIKMGCVALRETGGPGAKFADPSKRNLNPKTGDDSWGLCQLNVSVASIEAWIALKFPPAAKNHELLLDPQTNANVAYSLSRGYASWAVELLWFYRPGLQEAADSHLPTMLSALNPPGKSAPSPSIVS